MDQGETIPELRVTPDKYLPHRYAGASGDFNPIHHDQTFAEASGNPTVFAMGMLNASILSRVVTAFAGRPNVRRYKVRFATRAWPGDDVICRGRVTRKLEHGAEKLVDGRSGHRLTPPAASGRRSRSGSRGCSRSAARSSPSFSSGRRGSYGEGS